MASGKGISDTHLFGSGVQSNAIDPERVISLTEFENSIKLASAGGVVVTTQAVSAFVGTFYPVPGKATVQGGVLKAKSWALQTVAYTPDYTPGTSDVAAIIKALSIGTANIGAEIVPVLELESTDLPAYLQPHRVHDFPAGIQPLTTEDLLGAVGVISSVNLSSFVNTIPPSDVSATALAVPSIDLLAISGAHPPGNITALISSVLPVNLPVYVRAGFSSVKDIFATLTQKGQVQDLGVFLRLSQRETTDLETRIGVIGRGTSDVTANLNPYRIIDLIASITTQRISDVRAIVAGVSPTYSDMSASVARIDSAAFDIGAYTVAQFIALTDMAGKLRVVQLGGTDVPSSLTAVFPFYNLNRVLIQYVPLTNLTGVVIQVGGLSGVRASITPKHSQHTGVSDSAGFVTTATSYRFYLGTNRGVYIPTEVVKETRIDTFTNVHDSPDLHATISGWNLFNLSASLNVYPFVGMAAHIDAVGFDRVSNLSATLETFNLRDLQATVNPFGSTGNVTASVATAGKIDDLSAIIVSRIDILALKLIPVSTQPISDLSAIINYDSYVRCSPTSAVIGIAAHIRPLISGTPDNVVNLTASILSNIDALDITASVVSKKVTKVNILNLTFTLKERGSRTLFASIVPIRSTVSDVLANITGLSHEQDLSASVEVVRFELPDVNFTLTEQIVNLNTNYVKDIMVSFKSQVQHYVYESVTNAVYATDRGTWAIDLRTLLVENTLFDRSLSNRDFTLSGLSEFSSLDQAIRAGIVVLCERRQENLTATLQVIGKVNDMPATCFAYSLDNIRDLKSKLMPVERLPDISAQINTGLISSDLIVLHAVITPNYFEVLSNLSGDIFGDVCDDISATITAV